MNVFTAGHRSQPWVWQVTGLCFVLGLLLAGSLQTVKNISRSGAYTGRIGQPMAAAPVQSKIVQDQAREIDLLRKNNTKYENALGDGSKQLKVLNEDLQKAKILAGLTEVHGPGLQVTLMDSKKQTHSLRSSMEAANALIHDTDVQAVLNELGQSGAEAIAINGQRIITKTSLRCVGPTILINNVPLVPPYVISAIGDPDTLWGGINLPFGVLENLRRVDPDMVKLEKMKDMVIPAFTGSTDVRFAKPTIEFKGGDKASDKSSDKSNEKSAEKKEEKN